MPSLSQSAGVLITSPIFARSNPLRLVNVHVPQVLQVNTKFCPIPEDPRFKQEAITCPITTHFYCVTSCNSHTTGQCLQRNCCIGGLSCCGLQNKHFQCTFVVWFWLPLIVVRLVRHQIFCRVLIPVCSSWISYIGFGSLEFQVEIEP